MTVAAEQADNILQNPLALLGVSREGVQGLSSEQVLALARVLRDFHAKELRPDLSETSDAALSRWSEIDQAWNELSTPQGLQRAVRAYRPLEPHKEASLAERLVHMAESETDRTELALRKYYEAKNPIWSQGPCTMRVIDLEHALSLFPDENLVVDAVSEDPKVFGASLKDLPVNAGGLIQDGKQERDIKGILHLASPKDSLKDLFIRLRRAGLQAPAANRLLPPGESAGDIDLSKEYTSRAYNFESISPEQFAELALYVSPEANVTSGEELSLLVSVCSPPERTPYFCIEGVLMEILR